MADDSWSTTGLPSGLTINSSTGAISGTTSANGSASVTLRVADSSSPAATTSATFPLTISAAGTVTLSAPANQAVGQSTTPTLTWTAATNATSYTLYLDTVSPPMATYTVSGTSYTPSTALVIGQPYFWYVVPVNGSASGQPSVTWTFWTAGPPSGTSVSPASGGPPAGGLGTPTPFTFTFSSPNGWQQLWTELEFNYYNFGSGACLIGFWPATQQVALMSDHAVDGWQWIGTLGQSQTEPANSQCSVSLDQTQSYMTVVSPTTIQLRLTIAFQAGMPGPQQIWAQSGDNQGNTAYWQQLGTWTTSVVSNARPTTGPEGVKSGSWSGGGDTFTYQAASANGWAYLTDFTAAFAASGAGLYPGPHICRVDYSRLSNTISLETDNGVGDPAAQSVPLGSNQILSNSQCTLNVGQSSTQVVDANTLQWNVALTFNTSWSTKSPTDYFYIFDRQYQGPVEYTNTGWAEAGPYNITAPSTIVTSNPPGLTVTVDGTGCTTPCTFQWGANTSHTISAPATMSGTGVQGTFASWSDGGAATHTVTATASSTTYTATYANIQYYLTTAVSPANAGTVSRSSGWYNAGTQVTITESAAAGYVTMGFSGSVSTPAYQNSVTLTMNGPQSETALFGADFTMSISPSYQTIPPNGPDASYTITLASPGGYTGDVYVALSSLTSSCASVTYFPAGVNPIGTPLLLKLKAICGTGVQVSLNVVGTLGGASHSVTATLNIANVGDYSLTSSAPSVAAVTPPGAVSYTVTVTPTNGFQGTVYLAAFGAPSGSSGASAINISPQSLSFTGNNVSQSSVLTITTASASPPGSYSVTVTGTYASTVRTASASLTVAGTATSPDLSQMALLSAMVYRHENLAGPNAPSSDGGMYGLTPTDAATVNGLMDATSQQLDQLISQAPTFSDSAAYVRARNAILQNFSQNLQAPHLSAPSSQIMNQYKTNYLTKVISTTARTSDGSLVPCAAGFPWCVAVEDEIIWWSGGLAVNLGSWGEGGYSMCSYLKNISLTRPSGLDRQTKNDQGFCGWKAATWSDNQAPTKNPVARGQYSGGAYHSFVVTASNGTYYIPSSTPFMSGEDNSCPSGNGDFNPFTGEDHCTVQVDLQFQIGDDPGAQKYTNSSTVPISSCSGPISIRAVLLPGLAPGAPPPITWIGGSQGADSLHRTIPCAVGTTTITASVEGLSTSVTFEVPSSVTLSGPSPVGAGATFTVTATVQGGWPVTWSFVPDPAYPNMGLQGSGVGGCPTQPNGQGLITCALTAGQYGGKGTITATLQDGTSNPSKATARLIVVQIISVVAGVPAMQNSTTTMNFTGRIAQDSQGGLAWPDRTSDPQWKTLRHLTLVQGSTSLITLNVYSSPLADDPDLSGKIRFQVVQALDDVNAGAPTVTQPPLNEDDYSIQVNVLLSSPGVATISGSYQILVFVENSGDATWQAGDTGVTVPLILVQSTLRKNVTRSQSDQVTYLQPTGIWGAVTTLATVATGYNTGQPFLCTATLPQTCAILYGASVDLVGGGATGLRGTSEVFGGWVQNVTSTGYVATYNPGPHYAKKVYASNTPANGVFPPGGISPQPLSYPILDRYSTVLMDPAVGIGGNSSLMANSLEDVMWLPYIDANPDPSPALGRRTWVTSIDRPAMGVPSSDPWYPGLITGIQFDQNFSGYLVLWASNQSPGSTGTPSPAPENADGSIDCADHTYAVLLMQPWSITSTFPIDSLGQASPTWMVGVGVGTATTYSYGPVGTNGLVVLVPPIATPAAGLDYRQ